MEPVVMCSSSSLDEDSPQPKHTASSPMAGLFRTLGGVIAMAVGLSKKNKTGPLFRFVCTSRAAPECPEQEHTRVSADSNSQQLREKRAAEQERVRLAFEDVRSWAVNFETLMKNLEGRRFLTDFLKGEFSDENILFWQACEELKKETNHEKIEEKARIIYEDFISILSPKEVSLDSRVREIVNQNMANPTANTFDAAQAQIYTLMMRDSYPRFLNSKYYTDRVEELEQEAAGLL